MVASIIFGLAIIGAFALIQTLKPGRSLFD